MRALRDEETPHIHGYDQEAWARERHYAADNPRAALAAFVRFRRTHIAELSALSPAAWERPGYHEGQGHGPISTHTLNIVAHDAVHMAQLARQLAPPDSGPPRASHLSETKLEHRVPTRAPWTYGLTVR